MKGGRLLAATSVLAVSAAGATFLLGGGAPGESAPEPISFDRDIRPLLSDRCFRCHGPDAGKRKAELRLDSFESATAARPRNGGSALVPNDPEKSLLWQRVIEPDSDRRMPPQDSGRKPLTAEEKQLLKRWIVEGAVYEPHWSFVPPKRPEPPAVKNAAWCRTPIDRFILARLERVGAAPSPEADKATLARRVFLDLTGLPPTPEELTAFLDDAAPDAYDRLVDRLLNEEPYRSRYAERMASPWLDIARYADTCGIHMDAGRQIWPWRDWVLNALRTHMPYDQFVVQQLAGDLLPGATDETRVASGFNRNHVTSDEGGALNEEYLVEYAVDRVSTTGAAFMGLTLGCARCHDHKFDPVTQKDFYGLFAFFNSIEEPGIYSQTNDPTRAHEPFIELPSAATKAHVAEIDAAIAEAKKVRDTPSPEEGSSQSTFASQFASEGGIVWKDVTPTAAVSEAGATLKIQADRSVLASGENPPSDVHTITLRTDASDLRLLALEALTDPSLPMGRVGRAFNGNAILDSIEVEAVSVAHPELRERVDLTWAWADVEQTNDDFKVVNALRVGGSVWAVDAHNKAGSRTALFLASKPFGFEGGTELRVRLGYRSPYAQHVFGRVRLSVAQAGDTVLAALPEATSNWFIAGPFVTGSGAEAYDTAFGPEHAVAIDPGTSFRGQAWRYAPGVLEETPVELAQGVDAEYVAREIWSPTARNLELSLGSDDGLMVFVNGVVVHEHRVDRPVGPDQDHVKVPLRAGLNTLVCKVVNTGGRGGFFHRAIVAEGVVSRGELALTLPEGMVDRSDRDAAISAWRMRHSPTYAAARSTLQKLDAERKNAVGSVPRTMVMKERAKPRDTFLLMRGQYDKPDPNQPVTRSIPVALGALPEAAPRNRLGLAQWLVSPQDPLLARVTMNRMWELLFGRGIVKTSDDFGLQGEYPSHPELLDWLACELRDGGWKSQDLLRMIVTSATYRQASRVRRDLAEIDPENRLLAWFPRQRLTAEELRDQALYVSGLLKEQLGGPSVKPYQPDGLWQEVAMPQSNTRIYQRGMGDDLWRRSLYTYWKRAVPPPAMLALDAPTREYCATRRLTTNTPLQALVLWNDETFTEAARHLAARTLREPGDDAAHLRSLWRRATARELDAHTSELLASTLSAQRQRWKSAPDDARTMLKTGASPVQDDIDSMELASWTNLANAILSTDAAIVKD